VICGGRSIFGFFWLAVSYNWGQNREAIVLEQNFDCLETKVEVWLPGPTATEVVGCNIIYDLTTVHLYRIDPSVIPSSHCLTCKS
jgi:hypothetical protein